MWTRTRPTRLGGESVKRWTVWVGGSEMSSELLSLSQAFKIVDVWKSLGYDDVVLIEVEQ
jgi:hypothetical protein